MWLKTKTQPHLLNVGKYTELLIPGDHIEFIIGPVEEPRVNIDVRVYTLKIVNEGYINIVKDIDPDVAQRLVDAITDAFDAGEEIFDVDEFLKREAKK